MKKILISNWINVLGTVLGFYSIFFILATLKLFSGPQIFTFEKIGIETVGGSMMFFFGILIHYKLPFLVYVISLFLMDFILNKLLTQNYTLKQIIVIETLIFTIVLILFAIKEQSFNLLVLPLSFLLSQRIRFKILNKKLLNIKNKE